MPDVKSPPMKAQLSFLIIEDDKYTRLNLREILMPYGSVEEASSKELAEQKLNSTHYDIVLTDLELGSESGIDLISLIVQKRSHCMVVSSYEGEEVIERAYALGAKHFLSKHKLKEQLPIYIKKYLQEKNARLERFLQEDFITQDPELIQGLKRLTEINWKGQSLFISGPTGTGKSLLGKLIHEITNPEEKFVHLNCSEISESLLESELFGHEKGAFTGADQKKDGKLKLAQGGTLFLDEVGTMSLSMQQKLLKAIDEKTFYPVGSSSPVKSDFTLISATCEDLKQKISENKFREDFFFRITGFQFHLKPLRERRSDIELLLRHFQKKSTRRFVIKPEAIEALKSLPWAGNVRELGKMCERFSQSLTGIISLTDIPKDSHAIPTGQNDWDDYVLQNGLKALISDLEKRAVEQSLKRNNGKITACIKELKISSSAFYRILQEHQLNF